MMRPASSSVMWMMLHTPGHDACRFTCGRDGFALDGCAAFAHEGMACAVRYAVRGDADWQTRSGRVSGFLGGETVDIAVERAADGRWFLNGKEQGAVAGQRDLDLGFTPATNLIALRRFALRPGESVAAPAAYLLFPETKLDDLGLTLLEQSYARLDESRYDYSGPHYRATLTVDQTGFVVDYPGLWRAFTDPAVTKRET